MNMSIQQNRTSVAIKPSTLDALKAIGRKGQTYDDIIVELINKHATTIANAS